VSNFQREVAARIDAMSTNEDLKSKAADFMRTSFLPQYSYNFRSLGRPIIQYPQDIVAIQEMIWDVKPDLIIETGIAHGGSLILSAWMLAILDVCEAIKSGVALDARKSHRRVLGIDIDIRIHNRDEIENHPMSSRITMIEASSIDCETVAKVHEIAKSYQRVLVLLDSNHTHEHVLAELQAYAPLTSVGSYCVVFDTVIDDLPAEMFSDRPWGPGNNPKTAVWEYLKTHPEFEVDKNIEHKLLITVAPNGFLKRVL